MMGRIKHQIVLDHVWPADLEKIRTFLELNGISYNSIGPLASLPSGEGPVSEGVKEIDLEQMNRDTILIRAANCIGFLSQIIHGIAAGKADHFIETDFFNLRDHYDMLMKVGFSHSQTGEDQELWKEVEETIRLSIGLDPYRSNKIVDYLQSKYHLLKK